MGFFGDLLKLAAPVASFLPGAGPAIGAGLGAISAIGEGKKASKQRQKYESQQEAIVAQQQEYLQKTLLPMIQSFMQTQGWNPQTGKFESRALTPYADVPNPYDLNKSALLAQLVEPRDREADQQVEQALADLQRTGFAGSGATDAAIASIRNAARSDASGFRRDIGVRANEFESQRAENNVNESFRRMLSVLDAGNAGVNAMGTSLGTIGGLGNMAASRESAASANLAGLFGTIANSGLFGNKKRPADAGDNRLATNQSPTPIGGFQRPSLINPNDYSFLFTDPSIWGSGTKRTKRLF